MESPMAFWGVEVKVGQCVKVDPTDLENAYIHISQVALGEAKKDKASEPVVLYLKVGDQKVVLGTLTRDDIPHLSLDLVLDSESELSHSSKNSDDDEDLALKGQNNGKPEIKGEGAKVTKPSKPVPLIGASAKKVKTVDPKEDEEDESDDESDDELAGEDESGSSDEMDDDSDSDEESDSDEDEETPVKKAVQGKKRANESASKTPVSGKKAKNATPEKTDGKKSVHIATPYPMKKGAKTPNNATKGQTPNSAGQLSCASCKKYDSIFLEIVIKVILSTLKNSFIKLHYLLMTDCFNVLSRSFTNEVGLQQHKKAKHGDGNGVHIFKTQSFLTNLPASQNGSRRYFPCPLTFVRSRILSPVSEYPNVVNETMTENSHCLTTDGHGSAKPL
ncbi:Histone deacetylase HDT1, partial [Mucuna pruriens]